MGDVTTDDCDGRLLRSDKETLLPELDFFDNTGLSARLSRGDTLSLALRQPERPWFSSMPAEGGYDVREDTQVVFVECDTVEGVLPPVC